MPLQPTRNPLADEVEGLASYFWRMSEIEHWDAAFAAMKIIAEKYNDAYGIMIFLIPDDLA